MDYKIGDIFRNDADYSKRADFCNQNRLMIVEIEADENGRRFQIVEIPQPTERELAEQEIQELKQWFDTDYTRKEQKYRRLIALDKLDDDGVDGQTKLIALYEEAEEKRARIQELEKLI